ncbi:MAG: hypothetical protein CMJ51_04085 [Planctomycetaceae bacterium]|nr:hypothetical protein [Planctomycetaceae bacterium]
MRAESLPPHVSTISALVITCLISSSGAESPFATQVVDFQPGRGGVPGYDLPEVALGSPTRMTGGDFLPEAVTPFQPAWLPQEIVSIGVGGSITLAFDHEVIDDPDNPFGVDLLVFGNAFCTDPVHPGAVCGGYYAEGGLIEVSLNGIEWHLVPDLAADGAFPTVGWLDAGPYATTPGSEPTDFTRPVDPALESNLEGLGFDAIMVGYDGAGGGTGIDLAVIGIPAIRFVRITNDGQGFTPEVDAIADVAPVRPPRPDPDLDGDGIVGGGDLGLMLVAWGTSGPLGDLDGDGLVSGPDLGLLLVAWDG